jgi:hypothetical protein
LTIASYFDSGKISWGGGEAAQHGAYNANTQSASELQNRYEMAVNTWIGWAGRSGWRPRPPSARKLAGIRFHGH